MRVSREWFTLYTREPFRAYLLTRQFSGRHPTAINPTRELLLNIRADAELAKKIRVVVERKDVVYNIDLKTLKLE